MAKDDLQYFLNSKRSLVVASFQGCLNERNQHLLKKCLEEITALQNLRYVVLNLQGLSSVESGAIRSFTIVQSALRERYKLYLCNLGDGLVRELSSSGVIRDQELQKDLMATLQLILKSENG